VSAIRVGLVGAGPWAHMFHAPMLAAAPDIDLSAVWARRTEAAQVLAQQFGAIAAATFEELLDRCDAVAFSVPPDVQARYAPPAARAGKHLLLEKPLAFTLADAEAIAQAAGAAGVATQLVLTYRFTRPMREFLAAVGGTTVRYAHACWITRAGLAGSAFATAWRLAAGAALLDVGPHVLDLLEAAAGRIDTVFAAQSGGVTSITTRHAGGAVGQVALSLTTPGARGPLEADAVTDAGRITLPDPSHEPPAEVQRTIAEEFAQTVRGEIAQSIDVHRGVLVQRIIAAAARSITTGGPVSIAEH
jgi:predicted dehydrogenase